MGGIACPRCFGPDFTRYKAPANLKDMTFRRHRCRSCRGIFLTAQVVVSGSLAEKMLSLTETPIPGSGPTPSAEGMYLRTLLEEWRDEDLRATSVTQASSLTALIDVSQGTS